MDHKTLREFKQTVADLMAQLQAKALTGVTYKKPGRPRSTDRCPCGEMTTYRAEKRGHVCEAKEEMPWKD